MTSELLKAYFYLENENGDRFFFAGLEIWNLVLRQKKWVAYVKVSEKKANKECRSWMVPECHFPPNFAEKIRGIVGGLLIRDRWSQEEIRRVLPILDLQG